MKMYQSVLQRVRIIEKKSGITYADTDGTLYKTLRILYSVVGLYALAINLIFILGVAYVNSGTENFSAVIDTLISVSICSGLIIGGYVLSFFKFKISAAVVSVVPQIFLMVIFGKILRDDLGYLGFKSSYYWRHFIPLLLMIVLIVWTTVIAVRARLKTEKQYKKVVENLFTQFKINPESADFSNISEEQWNVFLGNYDPSNYKKLFKAQEQANALISED